MRPSSRTALVLALGGFALAVASPAWAAWQPLAGDPDPAAPTVTVRDEGAAILVDVTVPGFASEDVEVDGRAWARPTLPGAPLLRQEGCPELPFLPVTLSLPATGDPRVEVLAIEERALASRPPVPSLGHVLRDGDAAALAARPGTVYASDGAWPAAPAAAGRPFVLRHRRGVTVAVHPLRWDAAAGRLIAITRLTLAVRCDDAPGVNALSSGKAAADDLFADRYADLFANGAPADKDAGPAGDAAPRHMLIVCGDGLRTAVQPLAAWKRQRGIDAELVTMGDLGGTILGLRQTIAARYRSAAGLAYLLIVGDVEQVPTLAGGFEGADSDGLFAMIDGDDLYADFLVSRLPARTAAEAATMVAKVVGYERDPQPADAWCRRAVGIASDEGTPPDYERAELLRDDLLAFGFSDVARIYQSLGGTTAQIVQAAQAGASLINYLGHGTPTGWTSVDFTSTDVRALANGRQLPWIVDVSCSTGDFSRPECFAEAWLRAGSVAKPAGAVGMVAASTATPWIPPCVMQAEIVDRLVSEDTVELGDLFAAGMTRVLSIYGGMSVAQRMAEQYNLFGDCSLVVRKRIPRPLEVRHPSAILPGALSWRVEAPGAPGAVLALTAGDELVARAVAAHDGRATLAFVRPAAPGEDLVLTVTAADAVPVIVTVPVRDAVVAVGDAPVSAARLLGNTPNPSNPRTSVAFELAAPATVRLAVYDARGALVRELLHGACPAGRHEVAWDGCDAQGRGVASGTYLTRLEAGGAAATRSLTLVR